MSMKIHPRHVVTVLEVSGRISANESATALTEAVHQALHDGAINLVLDLRQLSYMDSTGVGELTNAAKYARSHDCDFKLLHPNPRVQDLLQITGLAPALNIYTDEQQALYTFTSSNIG